LLDAQERKIETYFGLRDLKGDRVPKDENVRSSKVTVPFGDLELVRVDCTRRRDKKKMDVETRKFGKTTI
jgi:hypothetical protein